MTGTSENRTEVPAFLAGKPTQYSSRLNAPIDTSDEWVGVEILFLWLFWTGDRSAQLMQDSTPTPDGATDTAWGK